MNPGIIKISPQKYYDKDRRIEVIKKHTFCILRFLPGS